MGILKSLFGSGYAGLGTDAQIFTTLCLIASPHAEWFHEYEAHLGAMNTLGATW